MDPTRTQLPNAQAIFQPAPSAGADGSVASLDAACMDHRTQSFEQLTMSSTVFAFHVDESAQDTTRTDERTASPDAAMRNPARPHGGSLEGASGGTDQGNSFTLCMQLHNSAGADSNTVAVHAQAGANATLQRSVLLVDDNRDASSSLAELLRMMGHEVVVADDGPESLSLVDSGQTFDVALLDIGLPGMSGHELAQLLRQRFTQPTLRLVALTGYGIAPDIAGSNGFDDYFVKPVDINALLTSICKAGRPAA